MNTYWNYRVIERRRSVKTLRSGNRRYVAVHKVTYSDKDKTKILNISTELMLPVGDTKKELARELTLIQMAAAKPAIPWTIAKTYLYKPTSTGRYDHTRKNTSTGPKKDTLTSMRSKKSYRSR